MTTPKNKNKMPKEIPDYDYTPGGEGQKVKFNPIIPTKSVYTKQFISTKQYNIGDVDPSSGNKLHGSVIALDGEGKKVRYIHRPKARK